MRLGRFMARALLAKIEQIAKESARVRICMGCAGVIPGKHEPGYVYACRPDCSRAGAECGQSTTDAAFAQLVLEKLLIALQACLPEAERYSVVQIRALLYGMRCDLDSPHLPVIEEPGGVRGNYVVGGRPVAGVVATARPGDELIACPWCGEPVAINAGVQRVSHELPVCPAFHEEMRKQPTFFDAAHFLASRKVSA